MPVRRALTHAPNNSYCEKIETMGLAAREPSGPCQRRCPADVKITPKPEK